MLCICHWFGYFSVAHACFWVIWDNLRNPFLPGNCKEENSLLNTDPSPDSWSDKIEKEMKISNMVWSWVRGDQRRHQILVLGSALPLIDATAVDQRYPHNFSSYLSTTSSKLTFCPIYCLERTKRQYRSIQQPSQGQGLIPAPEQTKTRTSTQIQRQTSNKNIHQSGLIPAH